MAIIKGGALSIHRIGISGCDERLKVFRI